MAHSICDMGTIEINYVYYHRERKSTQIYDCSQMYLHG